MNTPIVKMAVIVGLPDTVLSRIQKEFKGSVEIRSIPLKRDGGFRLASEPAFAAQLLETFADVASSYKSVALIVLPYHGKVHVVERSIETLESLGSSVCRAAPDQSEWPKVSKDKGMDNAFQQALIDQITRCIDSFFPEAQAEDDIENIKFEVLRGLASHNKMGENNHSHEDDLWKARANGLGPRSRDRIIKELMNTGILNRKKNKSKGGTGWVYWIANVEKACSTYPDLTKYTE